MSTTSNAKKSEQLGIPYGTACHRLRQSIMFSLIQELDLDICFRCSERIENVSEMSVEHKEAWLDNNVDLFWDLDNIAFSHNKCNTSAKRYPSRTSKRIAGDLWLCFGCEKHLPLSDFSLYNVIGFKSYSGGQDKIPRPLCKKCRAKAKREGKSF